MQCGSRRGAGRAVAREMSSCESCAASHSMRSVESSPSRQPSSRNLKIKWRDDFLAGGQRGIQVRDPDLPAARQPAFSTAQAIAMIRSVRNDVTLRFETFGHHARLHRLDSLAIDDSSTQGARVARGNAEDARDEHACQEHLACDETRAHHRDVSNCPHCECRRKCKCEGQSTTADWMVAHE